MEHFLLKLVSAYPQLALPIAEETRTSSQYRDAVLCGEPVTATPDFTFSPLDSSSVEDTPAGSVRVLCFHERADFEHAYRALACRCAPTPIAASTGAAYISGIINWDKINGHLDEYEAAGGTDRSEEFRRFTADKRNYTDSIILLSSGPYSDVDAAMAGAAPETWRETSVTIRKYHELTHFICRKLHPDDVDTVRDEIIADLMGICAAVGCYDTRMARIFLGIEDGYCHPRGRLINYVQPEEADAAAARANALIDLYKPIADTLGTIDLFALLEAVFAAK